MIAYKDVALKVLTDAAADCPSEGEVPPSVASGMMYATWAALQLGATEDEVKAAMYAGYALHDLAEEAGA